ncbi:MAG: FixH family protein [Saprospiraceae bacterium]
MKFNWGTGIFIFLALFIATLAFILYKSKQVDNSLVIDKYYEEDLQYQKKFEKIDNYIHLKRRINVIYSPGDSLIQLVFPTYEKKPHEGTITCYRASASSQDKTFDFKLDKDSIVLIPVRHLASGKWMLKLDWKWGDVPYYNERPIIIH